MSHMTTIRALTLRLCGIQHGLDGKHFILVNDDAGTGGSIVWHEGQTIADVLEELDARFAPPITGERSTHDE